MIQAEGTAQAKVRQVVKDLKGIRDRLRRIAADLPEAPMLPPAGEEEPEVPVGVRSIIECVVVDRIEPAIHDLGIAAQPDEDVP